MSILRVIISILLLLSSNCFAEIFNHEMGKVEFNKTPKKVVALDWVMAETLLSLGVIPYAVADSDGYRKWLQVPKLPDSVINLGSRREPNLELLSEIKPDLILMSDQLAPVLPKLQVIAPTMVFTAYNNDKSPILKLNKISLKLGRVLKKEKEAQNLVNKTEKVFTKNGKRLKGIGFNKEILIVRFLDESHLRVHGENSLLGNVLKEMHLNNAWQSSTNQWGFSSISLEKLAPLQKSFLVYLGPMSKSKKDLVFNTPIWNALAFKRENRCHELKTMWTFGGLESAQNFSNKLTQLFIK
ncbi:ABC transporter substrate-binding protein [Photobacterium sp. SKA34]|uniref:ABC transporter substrate-binding protein n=1 Tax=Photobacterium sp. SKA34 TaxID=121723 RepID=UPI003510AFA0